MNSDLEEMYKKKTELKRKNDPESLKLIEKLELDMAEKYSEDMASKIREEIKGVNCEDGGWNPQNLWKLRSKLTPRPMDPPTAMENAEGVLLTDPEEIQKESLKYFETLFKDIPMDNDYVGIQESRESLCKLRLKQCAEIKTRS